MDDSCLELTLTFYCATSHCHPHASPCDIRALYIHSRQSLAALSILEMHACLCVCAFDRRFQLLFPASYLGLCVCVCVSSTRLDATHLSNVLTLEQMWISKRACQSMTAYSCCWLLYAGFPMLHGSCTATESCLKCYCRIFSSIEERKQHQRGCRCNFKMINFWSHNCCLGSCWFFTGIILKFHELAKSVNACSEYQHLVWFIVQHWILIELILFLFLHLHLYTGVLPYSNVNTTCKELLLLPSITSSRKNKA